MSFPISPTNGQLATVNGIVYSYDSASFSWTRTASALSGIANLTVTNNANLTNIYSSVGNFTGNLVAAGIVGAVYYGQINLGTTSVNLNRASASQTFTGVGIDGTAATATNAINTQVTSNISSGTAYVTFVAASGNTAQNFNTSLTYNPNSGNLRAFGVLTDTGVYWAGNGAAFSSAPGGTSGQLQYNNNSQFTGANIVFNNANGNLAITSTTTSTSSTTGALVVAGGVGIAGVGVIGGNLVAASGTVSTSATTGALVVTGGVGISGNLFTSGWIVPTANNTQNLGSSTSWWGTIFGVSQQARYADLAENYTADQDYAPGTVVVFGGHAEITSTNISHDTRVAGVISTNPGYLMNAASEGLPVAFTGRVPCQVKGPVNKGTVLVTSNTPGVAEAMNYSSFRPGCVLGKSLENISDDSIKLIEVVVGRF